MLKYFRMNFIEHLFIWINFFTLKIQNFFGGRTKTFGGPLAARGLKTVALGAVAPWKKDNLLVWKFVCPVFANKKN
jgi:hypothetical protein